METNIQAFGAVANASSCTTSIQAAIDAVHAAGGGRVIIPAGRFKTGSLQLRSNVELHLEAGAHLFFASDLAEYPVVPSRWEGVSRLVYRACLYAVDAHDIAITGFGLLDGNGSEWWERGFAHSLAYPRPYLIGLDRCQRVVLRDFSAQNSPAWHLHPLDCDDVVIDNVSIHAPHHSPNTDGLDPESCRNVRISNCKFDVGDDCIAIKSGTEDTKEKIPCENITITNCTMLHGHGAVVLGSEMSGDIKNVTISNCIFQDTDRGLRFKSRRGRGGKIYQVRANNIVMERVLCPFVMNLYYSSGPRGRSAEVTDPRALPVTAATPAFYDLHFANITAVGVRAAAGFLYGLPESPLHALSFDHINIAMQPDALPEKPAGMTKLAPMSDRGFIIGCAQDVEFSHIRMAGIVGVPYTLEQTSEIRGIGS